MPDRLVKVLENGRLVTRGIFRRGNGVELLIDRNETLGVTLDWSSWLGADTIASVTNATSGPGISSEANTTTQSSFNVSGSSQGYIEARITTTAGLTKELTVHVRNFDSCRTTDYGRC